MPSSPFRESVAVAVVTVSYGSESVLPRFLASIATATSEPIVCVVADNRPGPENSVAALSAAAHAAYLPLDSNRGYGGGMNAAVATLPASVRWILLSNPDVVLHANAIDRLVARGESDPTIGAVGPLILTAEGDVYPSARAIPSLRTGVGHALFANLWTDNPWTRAYRRDAGPEKVARDAGWLSGACILVRRSAFDEVGGFDEKYFMYFEDVDLGYRLGRRGYRNVYEPAAAAEHSGAHSTKDESSRMVEAHHESAKRFLDRKYAGWYLWPIRTALRVGLAVRSAIVVRRLGR